MHLDRQRSIHRGPIHRASLHGGPVNAGETTTDLARCREVFDAQSAPLRAAAASLGQWEVHIGAMNKLVVGAITLKQATQFWNQTRVGASTKLKSFAAAREPFQQRSARCPTPSNSGTAIPVERRACYRAVAARNRPFGWPSSPSKPGRSTYTTWRCFAEER